MGRRSPVRISLWMIPFRKVMAVAVLIALGATIAGAQTRWDYTEVSSRGYDKHNAQVALDNRGNAHIVWGSKDPNHSGLQLFYTNDAIGRFVAPILATDTGSVFDSSLAAISSFAFRLDAAGAVHLAFIANVSNRLKLYYTNNAGGEFESALLVADQARYDLAVDSAGVAHIVWLSVDRGVIGLNYWNSLSRSATLLETLPCDGSGFGCSVGYPEIEVSRSDQLSIAFRADSSSIYFTQLPSPSGGLTQIPAQSYDRTRTLAGRADLRLRMALDSSGNVHLLAPIYSTFTRNRLLYISNSTGSFKTSPLLIDTMPASPSEFDLVNNGGDRLMATWTDTSLSTTMPRVGYAEYLKGSRSTPWTRQVVVPQLVSSKSATTGTGIRLAARGENVVISGLYSRTGTGVQTGLFRRAALAPRIAYMHPDVAAAGMNVVVESIAPYRDLGSFGPDGFHMDSVRLELIDKADSVRVVIGPSVVSWDGRVVSTMIFVPVGAEPGEVPMALRVNGVRSNVDTFRVVTPYPGRMSGGGVIGTNRRSRRGVLVVDSLVLSNGTFTIDTSDTDPFAPGNQGLLPVTILSLGPVRIDSTAVLDLSATSDIAGITLGSAGPGGGSGGSGGWIGAGSGFTAGGGTGKSFGMEKLGESQGSGGTRSGRWVGGPALNGAPGGAVYPEAAAGGGTGHPFGASGTHGRISLDEPTEIDIGGWGAGSAGYNAYSPRGTAGGGGGGFGTGGGSGTPGNVESNGGWTVGSAQMVPLAGGSGGGGGGFSDRGFVNGGSGGGALALISYGSIRIDGTVRADGAQGMSGHAANASGGGGGSGGGIVLSAKEGIVVGSSGRVSARGGAAGKGFTPVERDGGRGGEGRIRIDGAGAGTLPRVFPSSGYSGPATISGKYIGARAGERITGTGEPGSRIRIFVKPFGGKWSYNAPIDTIVAANGTWGVRLGSAVGPGPLTIVAMQQVANPSRKDFSYEPQWVMSAAAGNAVGLPQVRRAKTIPPLRCIRFDRRDTVTYEIENPAELAALAIRNARIDGTTNARFSVVPSSMTIPPGGKGVFKIIFDPQSPGNHTATFRFSMDVPGDTAAALDLVGCATTGLLSTDTILSLGSLCPGAVVDTTIIIRNTYGTDTLRVGGLASDQSWLGSQIIDGRPLPRVLPPGGMDLVRVRFTVRRFDPNGTALTFSTDAFTPVHTLLVRISNGQPIPALPSQVTFTPVDLLHGDDCTEGSVTISNFSTTAPIVLRRVSLIDPTFTLIDAPAADTTIAPGGRVLLRLKFCPSADGSFAATLPLVFSGGSCDLDTTIALSGSTLLAPAVEIISPADRTLTFAPVLKDTPTPSMEIVITNNGNAPATLSDPAVDVDAGTDPGEISVTKVGFWPTIPVNGTLRLSVMLTPTRVGAKRATIRLGSTDQLWSDAVVVTGEGTSVAGVIVPRALSFGKVRAHRDSVRELIVTNTGSGPVDVTELNFSSPSAFRCLDCATLLPATLPATSGGVRFRIAFTPEAEGEYLDSIAVIGSSPTATVYLSGTGTLETIAATPGSLDFGCMVPGRDTTLHVTIRNGGTAPLVVTGLAIDGGAGAFSVSPLSAPLSVPPNGFHDFDVTYHGSPGSARAILRVINSTGADLPIPLSGVSCQDVRSIRLWIPDTSAVIGTQFILPIRAELSDAVDQDIDYSVTLTYAAGLLRPPKREEPDARPATEGTLSDAAAAGMDELPVGTLLVRGRIKAGVLSGTLVGIPMRVLLSNVNITDIEITNVTIDGAALTLSGVKGGQFTALDCDTTRRIVTGGGYKLNPNVPNPATSTTRIDYTVAFDEHVVVNLYDATGTRVRTLVDRIETAGDHTVVLDRTDLLSGVYYYELVTQYMRLWQRMVIVD